MFGLRWPELLLIFAVVVLLFGASRLPELGKALGTTLRGFKKSVSEDDTTASTETKAPDVDVEKKA